MSGSPKLQFQLPISHLGTLELSLPLASSTNVSIHLHLTLTNVMPHMVIKQLPGGLQGDPELNCYSSCPWKGHFKQ